MLKKILPVIIITVCLLFAGCKAPADQEQKNNTETAVLSTETQEEDWKQVHSMQLLSHWKNFRRRYRKFFQIIKHSLMWKKEKNMIRILL